MSSVNHFESQSKAPPITSMQRPAQQGAPGEFIATDWRPFAKNTLRGFLTLETPSGMILHGCSVHEKGTSRWIGLPAQKFTKDDGTTSYTPVVEFASREARDRFNGAAVRAVDRLISAEGAR